MIANRSAALLAMLAGEPAQAADRMVILTGPPPLARHLAALPRIGDPRDAAERRINAAFRRLDGAVRKVASACRGRDQGWQRAVRVTMRGPGYLSYEVTDGFDCGSAHPEDGTYTVVYDLRTGRAVDWTTLLPPALTDDAVFTTVCMTYPSKNRDRWDAVAVAVTRSMKPAPGG